MMARGAAQGALPVKVNKNILCVSAVFKLREIFRPFYRWLLPRLLLLFLLLLLLLLLRQRRLLLLLYGNFSIFFICIVWGALCFVSNAYGKLTFKACSHPLPPSSLLPFSVRIVCANLSSLWRCLGVLSAALIEVYLKCVFINVKMTIIPVMFEVSKRDFCIRKFRKCECELRIATQRRCSYLCKLFIGLGQ